MSKRKQIKKTCPTYTHNYHPFTEMKKKKLNMFHDPHAMSNIKMAREREFKSQYNNTIFTITSSN